MLYFIYTDCLSTTNTSLKLFLDPGSGEETLSDLVQFWTAWPSLPMLNDEMKVGFLPNDPNHILAMTDTCFNKLAIPTIHKEYKDFAKYLDISVSNGKVAFGKF